MTPPIDKPLPTVLLARFTFQNDVAQAGVSTPSADQLQAALTSPNLQTLDPTISARYTVTIEQKGE